MVEPSWLEVTVVEILYMAYFAAIIFFALKIIERIAKSVKCQCGASKA